MKSLFALCLLLAAPFLSAAEKPAAAPPMATAVKGQVLDVTDVEGYTYLRLKTEAGETWAAVPRASLKKEDKVTIENVMVMSNFTSKSLKKTFPTILFGTLADAGHAMAAAHGSAKATDAETIHVAKAGGADGRTVAEIITKRAELKDKVVLVRGKVVKYNPQIMGKNWVHLRDGSGSGSAADDTDDLLVTTTSQAKAGDVVTAKGVVRTDKDFGAGYAYRVLIEDATLQQ